MSGDVTEVEIAGDADGAMASLLHTLEDVQRQARVPIALVGGLAVMARLGERHRVTVDVDTVYLGDVRQPSLGRALVAAGGTATGDSVEFQGVKIDTIEVSEIVEDQLPDDLIQRSFVLAHRWALDSATPVRLVALFGAGGPRPSALMPTATAPALIAMKLSSFPTRRAANRQHKQSSDLYDLYRLLNATTVAALQDAYATAPHNLGATSASLAQQMIGDRANDTIKALKLGSGEMAGVTLDDFASALDTLFGAVAMSN